MAQVKLDWQFVEFPVAEVGTWKDLKSFVSDAAISTLRSRRAVYVIRIKRPFAFAYTNGVSPVAYIGKGNAQQRITSHLKTWIWEIWARIPETKIRIYFCEPRVRKLGSICEHVEADLIARFRTRFRENPLRNKQIPQIRGKHIYIQKELDVLICGKGKGYHWAITPMRSSPFLRTR
jgi:hypothetical protein